MRIPPTWTFDDPDVASTFDQHVREQLPWYEMVTSAVVQIGRHYLPDHGLVYDLGAANGNIARALRPVLVERQANIISIESSAEMAETFSGPGVLHVTDATSVEFVPCDLVVSMLTLMFLPPVEWGPLLDRIITALRPGGALVVVERTLPPDGYPAVITSRLTLAAKRAAGATGDAIVAKELALAGVQRPIPAHLLTSRGATEWFRYGDFAGYLIEKAT